MSHDPHLIQTLQAEANRLRIHSINSTTSAGSGHPTTCLSAADIMSVLFFHVMRWDREDPDNPNADRFVLSKGHAAPVLYAAWADAGIIPVEALSTLRNFDSDLEGHPTPRLPFVDMATGSLGQGLGVGVGLALNAAKLDKTDARIYVLMGDGEIAEGSVWEAAQLASHYKLQNLVGIVDMNRLGQSQPTALEHETKVLVDRFAAFGWKAVAVDGHDIGALLEAFENGSKVTDKPLAIIACTYKGKGVSFAENKDSWHGKPFSKEEAEKAIAEITAAGADPGELTVHGVPASDKPRVEQKQVEAPSYNEGDIVATREAYGVALVKLGAANDAVVGLDADTKNSTFSDKFMKAYPDRFFECFIAEQNMISVAAGLAARGKVPFASTFAVFLSRGFDQVRMAGISGAKIKLCGSHVGVSIGEDGPSQMGLEDLALYRTIPNAVVFYPSDAVSTEHAVRLASEHDGIAYIRTSRPKTKIIYGNNEPFEIGKAKVVRKSDDDLVTIATAGVTLHEALKAAEQLAEEDLGVRVIDLFTIKPLDKELLAVNAMDTGFKLLTVEDHYLEGGIGEAVSSALSDTEVWVSRMGVTGVPRSGKPEELLAFYEIDAAAIVKKVKELTGRK